MTSVLWSVSTLIWSTVCVTSSAVVRQRHSTVNVCFLSSTCQRSVASHAILSSTSCHVSTSFTVCLHSLTRFSIFTYHCFFLFLLFKDWFSVLTFSALTLLVGHQKECVKNWATGWVLAWLSVWTAELQMTCISSSWCHCHSIMSYFIHICFYFFYIFGIFAATLPGCPGKETIKWFSWKCCMLVHFQVICAEMTCKLRCFVLADLLL